MAAQIASGTNLPTAPKFSFESNQGKMQNFDPRRDLRKELEKVGESMKFQNPLIWLYYKYSAYADEPGKAINTVGDLIAHCDVDGICYRRFDAINLYLRHKHEGKDMKSSRLFSRDIQLDKVAEDPRFIAMCLDTEFATLWSNHENSKSGKWKEYILSSVDHDCEVNCTC